LVLEWFRQQHWTPEAYLALSANSNHLMELSEGKLRILPMPSLSHQRAVRQFILRVVPWLEEGERGELVQAPHPVRLWPGKYREPDAMVYLAAHRDRLGETESGPPDLALEVHSPGTTRIDLIEKFEEYARAGVSEYWMLDLRAQRLSIFPLDGDAYRLLGHFGPGERVRSAVLTGFELAVDDLLAQAA
jgi:Uma2 family endonuclease